MCIAGTGDIEWTNHLFSSIVCNFKCIIYAYPKYDTTHPFHSSNAPPVSNDATTFKISPTVSHEIKPNAGVLKSCRAISFYSICFSWSKPVDTGTHRLCIRFQNMEAPSSEMKELNSGKNLTVNNFPLKLQKYIINSWATGLSNGCVCQIIARVAFFSTRLKENVYWDVVNKKIN